MVNNKGLSAADRAAFGALLEAPEVIEVHGNDSTWRNGLLGSILSAAAMTFTMAAAAPNAHADSLFERTLSSVATNAASSALGGLVRQGIQGGADSIKRGVMGEAGGPPPGPTIFNQRDRQPTVYAGREVTPQGALPAPAYSPQPPQAPQAGGIFQNVTRPGQALASALGFGGSDVPGDAAGLQDAMVRNNVGAIAQTAPLRPVMFPVVIKSGEGEYAQFNAAAARATSVVPAGPTGQALVRDGLMLNQGRQGGPTGAVYVGSDRRSAACMIVMHAGQPGDAGDLSRISGMPLKAAIDFAVIREAARCTQQAETVAAEYDAANGDRARAQARMASGLVDVHSERAIASGSRAASPATQQRAQRSADRYADAFAALAVNARQPLSDQQWDGVWAWRMGTSQTQDTSNFLHWVRDQVQRDPIASQAMRSDSGAGFNAQAVVAFLTPVWKNFEARESELEGNRDRSRTASNQRPRSALLQSLGFDPEDVASNDNRNVPGSR